MSLVELLGNSIYDKCIHKCGEPLTYINVHNSDRDDELKHIKIKIEGNKNSDFMFIEFEKIGKAIVNTNLINIDWINRRTDAILYVFHENIHKFIVIEVKSKNIQGCTNQFKSMHAVLVYLIQAMTLLDNTNIEIEKVKIAKVLVSKRIVKGNSGSQKKVYFNQKINANEIEYKENENLKFNKLLDCKFRNII